MSEPAPFPSGFEVPHEKVVSYLLDLSHPRGGSKAKFFLSFGFSRERPAEFAAALTGHVRVQPGRPLPDGEPVTLVFEGAIPSPDGRNPLARSVWRVEPGGDVARLITVVPIRAPTRP
ncbi:DUF6883 domain-containing protein [Methylobacterium sp. ID0610]|uniref:DUF6883 domain-containing protein n=1 Tax=Methylobacterium carpenticola TaxID=3344827 RepID=UPI0036CF7517